MLVILTSEENLGLLNIPKGMLAKEETRELISLISKGKRKDISEQIASFIEFFSSEFLFLN